MSTTNILDLNNRVNALEKAVSGGDSAQANKKDIATEFSSTTAYTAGCFVYYQGKLYQFNTDHSAGAWDPTDVVEANVTDQVISNKAAIDGLTASDIMMSDGVTSVEDALDDMQVYEMLSRTDLLDESTQSSNITLTSFYIIKLKGLPIGRLRINLQSSTAIGGSGADIGTLKNDIFYLDRPLVVSINDTDGKPEGTVYVNKPASGPVKVYQIQANKTYMVDAFVFLNT